MNLIRQAALVAGLLTGVFYTATDHVESRRPLLAAPQIEDAGVVEQSCEGATDCEELELESDCFTSQDRASLRKALYPGQA